MLGSMAGIGRNEAYTIARGQSLGVDYSGRLRVHHHMSIADVNRQKGGILPEIYFSKEDIWTASRV